MREELLLLSKKQEIVEFEKFPTLGAFSGMLQLLCTYDLQLSQGSTVNEKSAPLHGTPPIIKLGTNPILQLRTIRKRKHFYIENKGMIKEERERKKNMREHNQSKMLFTTSN